jgi:hypothetical protein
LLVVGRNFTQLCQILRADADLHAAVCAVVVICWLLSYLQKKIC